MDFKTLFKFLLITNRIDILSKDIISSLNISSFGFKGQVKTAGIKNLFHEEKKAIRYIHDDSICCIDDDLIDIIVRDKRVSNDTISYILSKHERMTSVWYQIVPYIIHQSYLYNNLVLLEKCISVAITNNRYAYENYSLKYDSYEGYNYDLLDFLIANRPNPYAYSNQYFDKGLHGLVRILEKTIKLALDRGDFDFVDQFNKINSDIKKYYNQFDCYIATDDEIRVAKLKADKSVSPEELVIQSSLHNGILNVEEILTTKNYGIIQKASAMAEKCMVTRVWK